MCVCVLLFLSGQREGELEMARRKLEQSEGGRDALLQQVGPPLFGGGGLDADKFCAVNHAE